MVIDGCWLCGVEPSVLVISMASTYLCGFTWQPVGSDNLYAPQEITAVPWGVQQWQGFMFINIFMVSGG